MPCSVCNIASIQYAIYLHQPYLGSYCLSGLCVQQSLLSRGCFLELLQSQVETLYLVLVDSRILGQNHLIVVSVS